MKMRIGSAWLVAAGCSLALIASVAQAQPQRGFGGGPGGFGGGFAGSFGGGFGGGGLADVLRREDARKELELLDDQVGQLEKLNESRRDKWRDMYSGMRDVPQEQRGEKFRELSQKAQQDLEAELGKILLPHQMKRAKQLAVQLRLRGGVRSMLGDQMAVDLSLTEEQKGKLRTKSEQLEEELRKKLAEMRSQAQEELLQVLTPAQQAKWKEMVGEPFEFQRDETPRPGGGPQGGEAGARPRRGGGR
jgi:Spy/CpxP family protein refolding chaperone